ncbi:MAG: CBS domain-containing protein [Bacillota bacterium]
MIISHNNMDFDALGAMLGAFRLFPAAFLVLPQSLAPGVREFLSLHKDLVGFIPANRVDAAKVSEVVVVDTSSSERLACRDILAGKMVHLIDHHPAGDITAQGLHRVEPVGAACTLLVELLQERGIKMSTLDATALALGIHSDTGGLSFLSTTSRDARALACCLDGGANLRVIGEFLEVQMTGEQYALMQELASELSHCRIKGVDVAYAAASADRYVPGLSMLASRLADLSGAEALFVAVYMDGRTYVVARSRTQELDVTQLLAPLGGRGHRQAASVSLKGVTAEEAMRALLLGLDAAVVPARTAADLMSTPVKTVRPDTSVEEANRIMLRLGHSGLPVVDEEGRLVGIISRRDVDKVLTHELGHAPVRAYMSVNVLSVSPDTPVEELRRIMVTHDKGRLPVVDGGVLLGIVTRSDLLRVLYGDEHPRWHRELFQNGNSGQRENLSERLASMLPEDMLSVVTALGEVADGLGVRCYLVGGIVRDLLLGVRNFDLDVTVEGDGVQFAHAVAQRLGGKVRAHREFGTATVQMPELCLDVASSRREYYEYSGALPKVEFASIKEDLRRRDFTINAMALSINRDDFLTLIDYYGGQEDLQNRIIRVLHNMSFIEDPTRLFRAVRFLGRYGFEWEKETLALAMEAVRLNAVSRVSVQRLTNEVILLLSEPDPPSALKALARINLFEPLFHISWTTALERELKRTKRALAEVSERVFSRPVIEYVPYLLVLARHAGKANLVMCQLSLKKGPASILESSACGIDEVLGELDSPGRVKPSAVYEALSRRAPEEVAFLLAVAPSARVRRRIRQYLSNLAEVKLESTGRDLIEMGFPPSVLFKMAMDAARRAKLDGKISSKEQELKFMAEYIERKMKGEQSPDAN